MKKSSFFFVLMGVVVAGGCASPRAPVIGLGYTDVKNGILATSNPTGNRVGEACATTILGVISTGDASIETARRNGGITMITSVDETHTAVLGFIYGKYCTIVRGR